METGRDITSKILMSDNIITWVGEKNRPKMVRRSCPCGTCQASKNSYAPNSVGYLSWSDADGNGTTVWINSEENYQTLKKKFGEV